MSENKQLYEKQNNSFNPFYPLVRLEDIMDTISDKSIQWLLANYNHIYVEWQDSIAETRNKIPAILRRNGLWITYNNGDKLVTEFYKGTNKDIVNSAKWADDDNWEVIPDVEYVRNVSSNIPDGAILPSHLSPALQQLLGSNNTITNLPDEEDLTTECMVLKLKDREYNLDTFSGLGKVILRKNLMKGADGIKNILTQEMINKENTIYEIRYDYDLNGKEITIPEECVLDFQGGSLSNGNVKGNNTVLVNNNIVIFDNINITGTWECHHITDKMFFYEEGKAENNTKILTNLFSLSSDNINNTITISRKYKYIPIYNSGLLVKSNTTISGGGEIYVEPCSFNYTQLFRVSNVKNVIIENLKLVGDVQSHLGSTGEWNYGIYLRGSKNCIVRNCDISEFWGDGINVQKSQYLTEESANEVDYEYHCHNVLIDNCTVSKNRRNNISIEAAIGVVVSNCKCVDAGTINGRSPRMGIDIEPIPDNNQIVKNVIISNCCFEGNIGKDIAVPASMVEGYLNINNCDLNSLEVWGFSSNIDICIENSKIKAANSVNIHTAGILRINNNHITSPLLTSSKEIIINSSNFTSISIGSTPSGNVYNSNFTQISFQNSSNIVFNNCFGTQIYVHKSISDITFKNCNIVGASIIMFNANVEVNNIICENCNFKNNNENKNPFIVSDCISSNCLMQKCTIDIAYSDEIWLPFNNFINCNISATKVKILHDAALFENCNITTDNPITLPDIANINDVQYVFRNTYIYTLGQLLTKSSGQKATYVKVIGGNINRSQESSALFFYFTQDSIVNNSNLTKDYTYINYVYAANEDDARYACLRLPKISKGSIYITKYPSARYQSEIITEDIKIAIYNNNYKCSIKTVGNSISVSDFSKLTYPKVYADDDYIYIIFICINGIKSDAVIKATIYSDSVIDSTLIGITRISKDISLTNIPTYIEDCIADTTEALKAIPIIERVSLQKGYSTNENKPLWWTGTTWADATGTEI